MGAASAVILLAALVLAATAAFLAALAALRAAARAGGVASLVASGMAAGEKALDSAAHRLRAGAESVPLIGRSLEEKRAHDRSREIRQEMPRAIRLMCISLESGGSVSNALEYAAANCSGALAAELQGAVWDIEAGQSFEEAMERLRTSTGGSEFAYLAVAMEIQHACGGQLGDVLQSVTVVLQQEIELEELLVTKTSQGQLSSKVLIVMPLVLLGVMTLCSPGYLSCFFTSPLGFVLLVVALTMEAAGIVLVRRFLRVDLSISAADLS